MLAAAPVYCIDTSSILVWFVDTYPPMIFPGLLARMEGLIDGGRLCAPRAVLDEIRPGDACHKWCKEQPALFLEEPVSVQRIVTRLKGCRTALYGCSRRASRLAREPQNSLCLQPRERPLHHLSADDAD
jgi:hypothetical protein